VAASKRTLKSRATKERIRNVALNLMRSNSIDQISVQDICAGANVGVGTFYHYYKTKDDIVYEVYNDMDVYFLSLFDEAKLLDLKPYEYVLRHFSCYTRFITETTVDFARKVYSSQSKAFLNKDRPVYTTLRDYLQEKQKQDIVSMDLDLDDFCSYINMWLRGISYDWCLHDGRYDLVQRGLQYADNILAGYRDMLGEA